MSINDDYVPIATPNIDVEEESNDKYDQYEDDEEEVQEAHPEE